VALGAVRAAVANGLSEHNGLKSERFLPIDASIFMGTWIVWRMLLRKKMRSKKEKERKAHCC
jgi:hypothetical protein